MNGWLAGWLLRSVREEKGSVAAYVLRFELVILPSSIYVNRFQIPVGTLLACWKFQAFRVCSNYLD